MKNYEGIRVRGAREHNLKNISLDIPRNKITVITGLSGSGKSSLAFDTIYAEGQRRYLEGLSAYARNFLEQLKKPDVDSILGLSPAISIEQKTGSTNPRSTVGTVTEAYDFLRLLFAKIGKPYCPKCKKVVETQTHEQIIDEVFSYKTGSKLLLLAPVAVYKKGEFKKEIEQWQKLGFIRAVIDGTEYELAKAPKLKKTVAHNIELIIDRIIIKDDVRTRISQSISKGLDLAKGQIIVEDFTTKERKTFSQKASCPTCGLSFPEIEPLLFSFNSPKGACVTCNGIGTMDYIVSEEDGDDINEEVEYYDEQPCHTCHGARLKKEALHIFIENKNISHYSDLSIKDLIVALDQIQLTAREALIAEKIIKHLQLRLTYMDRVGVSYITLSRPSKTLSGGEAQRIRLASQLGSGLMGVLYVLDEPSIGLHPKDHKKLLEILEELRSKGNTILVVEHDEETILSSDLVFDIGPGAGVNGGNIQAFGTPKELMQSKNSITGDYLSGRKKVFSPAKKRDVTSGPSIDVVGASGNNLKNINVKLPLNGFTAVTGVSGSGKSTLVIDTIYKYIHNKIHKSDYSVAPVKNIKGTEAITSIVNINQKPIGRTPRSNPATYTGLMTLIRTLFAEIPEAKIRGFKPGYFSFNVKGGRCEHCRGGGAVKVEMNFLADVYVECDYCQGLRYNPECLGIRYKGKNIADILNMSVEEALEFFTHHKIIYNKLKTLDRVGLTYIKLGQSSTTLSGGEAQRIKLSRELSRRPAGHILYILDEPTTGLHFADVSKLLELLHELVDNNNTVLVIEHNLDVIHSADYIIELGPEGGPKGGEIINASDHKSFLKNKNSPTASYKIPEARL
ncbi:MAG: excinuclease ABC subunit UvrA [Bdellovibrionales bacterium]|nr:excinuclease ABC subunit UvrA [Bdellovibrionales bacterium]